MHSLAFVNQKGGCGKTTSAVHLAGALARGGQRALLVDLDPQAHATMALGAAVEEEPTLAEVLLDGVPPERALWAAPGGIHLLPGSLRLAELEERQARLLGPERLLGLALEGLRGFDFVLIDCPPRADGVLTANALRAADTVVLVVETGAFALQGALRALEILEEVAEGAATSFALRVLCTLYDRRLRLSRELLIGAHARFGPSLFESVIHASVRLREAPAWGLPVQVLDPGCRSCHDFDSLAAEVREHARAFDDLVAPARVPPVPEPTRVAPLDDAFLTAPSPSPGVDPWMA